VTVVTDLRSEKVAQIRANPAAEFAWYFPDSREQFRIAGDLVVVDKGASCHTGPHDRVRAVHAVP